MLILYYFVCTRAQCSAFVVSTFSICVSSARLRRAKRQAALAAETRAHASDKLQKRLFVVPDDSPVAVPRHSSAGTFLSPLRVDRIEVLTKNPPEAHTHGAP